MLCNYFSCLVRQFIIIIIMIRILFQCLYHYFHEAISVSKTRAHLLQSLRYFSQCIQFLQLYTHRKSPSAILLFPHTLHSCLSNSILTFHDRLLPSSEHLFTASLWLPGKDGEFVSEDEGRRRHRHHRRRKRRGGHSSIRQSTLSPRNTPRR